MLTKTAAAAALLALIPAVLAVPTKTEAKRSTGSGASACYFKCPPTQSSGDFTFVARQADQGASDAICEYMDTAGTQAFCFYAKNTGALQFASDLACDVEQAPIDHCGGDAPDTSSGSTQNAWKRSTQRDLTDAERAIQDRQYRPAASISSAIGVDSQPESEVPVLARTIPEAKPARVERKMGKKVRASNTLDSRSTLHDLLD